MENYMKKAMLIVLSALTGQSMLAMESDEKCLHNYVVYNNTPDVVINVGGTQIGPNNKDVRIQTDNNSVEVRRSNALMYKFTTAPGGCYAVLLAKLDQVDPLDPHAEIYRIAMINLLIASTAHQEITIRLDPSLGDLVRTVNHEMPLAHDDLPNDAQKVRLYARKLVQSNQLSINKLLPLIAFARKLDHSWVPMISHDQPNSVIDRINAQEEIGVRFPQSAVTAAKQAYQALEATHLDTIIGSSNRMKYKEKTGNWITCANTKNVPIDRKSYRLDWKPIVQPQGKKSYKPSLKESWCRINFNADELVSPGISINLPAWLSKAVLAYYDRVGNCGYRAALTLYYLIKNSFSVQIKMVLAKGESVEKRVIKSMSDAIKRVEQVEFTDLDHVFLVVNRAEGSEIANPKSWGENALVVEPWLWDKPDLRLYPVDKAAQNLIQVRELIQEEVLALQYHPLMTADMLEWWNAREGLPLPIAKAPVVTVDNLPLKVIDNIYVNDFQAKDGDDDVICLLPDMTKFTVTDADSVTPDKVAFDAIMKALQEKKAERMNK